MLKELTLSSLGETKAGEQFEEAMQTVRHSLSKDADVQGARNIIIKLSFKPDERGCILADISVNTNTPRRKIKSLAMLENGQLKIDTVTNDAKQPSLLEGGEGKVAPIRKEGGR